MPLQHSRDGVTLGSMYSVSRKKRPKYIF